MLVSHVLANSLAGISVAQRSGHISCTEEELAPALNDVHGEEVVAKEFARQRRAHAFASYHGIVLSANERVHLGSELILRVIKDLG